MGFNTSGQEVKQGGGSKGFNPGVVYAHVFDTVIRTASTGKKQLQIILAGPAIEGFEGWDIDKNDASKGKHKGLSSMVNGSIYVDESVYNNTDLNANPILNKLVTIADETGVRDRLDAITANSLEEWVIKATQVVKGLNLYFFLTGTEEMYNDKKITKLSLPKFKFAAATAEKLDKFDVTNKYHFKALDASAARPMNNVVAATVASEFDVVDEPPF